VALCELCVLSRRYGPDAAVWAGLDKCGKEIFTFIFFYKLLHHLKMYSTLLPGAPVPQELLAGRGQV
jgi:hypothetical protein